MKAFQLVILLLFSTFSLKAQSPSNDQVSKMIAQLRQQAGEVSFVFKGKSYKLKASLIELAQHKGYAIMGGVLEGSTTLSMGVEKITPGSYPTNKLQSILTTATGTYLISDGSIVIQVQGGKISGSFKGKIYAPDGKGKFSKTPSGDINGTFSGLSNP